MPRQLKPVFIHKQEPLTQPKFLTRSATAVSYTRGDKLGRQHIWEVGRSHGSVHILVNNTDTKELILVKQVRIPVLINQPNIHNGEVIECCAGLCDMVDVPECMIARIELHEELGYNIDVERIEELPPYLASVGTTCGKCYPYYCEVTNADFVGQALGKDEDIVAFPLPYNDIKVFLENTVNTDATTRMLLQWWLLNKEII